MLSCGKLSKTEAKSENPKVAIDIDIKNQIENDSKAVIVGANQTKAYIPLLKGKRVGIVANQTSVIFKTEIEYTHLVDSLLAMDIDVQKVFAPEHGFRGQADAGELVKDSKDIKTGLSIISLYGKNKKPTAKQLGDLDIVVFDIQDVGARFYTYIYTMQYVMEACAELNIPVIVLDRPNPNGHYIDGPILEKEHESFVGMNPVPVVYGMTIGEYAKMVNGERWMEDGIQCKLTVIPIKYYTHDTSYSLPIKPSPNLPNDTSVNLYPSLCFFEGTNVNAGRGTNTQFQVFGSPFLNQQSFTYLYTPKANEGAKYPKHENKLCYGLDLTNADKLNEINLTWLINTYHNTSNKEEFFNDFFTKLAGTMKLQQQIKSGLSQKEIKATWQDGLEQFKKVRAKYLLYD